MEALFAVAGNPILKSRSPEIMNAAFRARTVPAVYTRIAASGTADIIDTAKSMGIKGLNITAPFKEVIIPYLDDLDRDARTIGSVNTVVDEDGGLKGYNTDFIGVTDALISNGADPHGKDAVVLGASGAARAAVFALLSAGAQVTVINRTFPRARGLARDMGCASLPMEDIDEAVRRADILVSCIPSCDRVITSSSFGKEMVVLDACYSLETPLTRDAYMAGARVIDGREWLLFQALPAFRLFTGRDAPVDVMRKALYEAGRPVKTNVGLIGFMGSGKSSAGQRVAARMHMAALDTDKAIVVKTGLSISDIFGRHGEEGFRFLEEAEVGRVEKVSRTVISFGGGAVLRAANRDIINERCVSIWLWASPDAIMDRIGDDGERPLLEGQIRKGEVEAMLKARLPFYARTADCIINTDRSTPDEITERICHEISKSL
jgi:shikimate dehydrogenase